MVAAGPNEAAARVRVGSGGRVDHDQDLVDIIEAAREPRPMVRQPRFQELRVFPGAAGDGIPELRQTLLGGADVLAVLAALARLDGVHIYCAAFRPDIEDC